MKEDRKKLILDGLYYAESHEIFRGQSNQQELMLKALQDVIGEKDEISILSVGAGSGLFEIPLLKELMNSGIGISQFMGIDINLSACKLLEARLAQEFGSDINYYVEESSLEDFSSDKNFDLVLFNHVFEYIDSGHVALLEKSLSLISKGGEIVLFSPLRGGINHLYEMNSQHLFNRTPYFSDDIEGLLRNGMNITFEKQGIIADCKIDLLIPGENEDLREKMLSFLCQIDCRKLPPEEIEEAKDFFLSITESGILPHPTDMFIIKSK